MGVCSPRRLFAWLGSALPLSSWHKAAPERSEGRGGRSSSGCIARCRTAQPGDVCEMLPPSPELFPGSPSSPNRGSGWFLIVQGAALLSCHPSLHSAPAAGDVSSQSCTSARLAPSLCAGTPFLEICFNHIYTL